MFVLKLIGTFVLGFISGVFLPTHYRDWWDRTRKRQEAARFFLRNAESARTALEGLWRKIENRSTFAAVGPRGLRRDLESLDEAFKEFHAVRDRLFDLRNEALEKRLTTAFSSTHGVDDGFFTGCARWYPENLTPDLIWDAQMARTFEFHAEAIRQSIVPIFDQLIVDLRRQTRIFPRKTMTPS